MTPFASLTIHLLTDGEHIGRALDVSKCDVDPAVMAGVLRELADELDAVAAHHEARKAGVVVASPVVGQA